MGASGDGLSAALFGKTRRNVLGLLFVEPHSALHLREIVRRTRGGQGSVQRELRRLAAAGILLRRRTGAAIVYQANSDSPVFNDLRNLLVKTTGVVDRLRAALAPLHDRIEVAFIYGSLAREAQLASGSDVDLMVVGNASFGEIVEHVATVQESLGRDINPTVYSRSEFARRSQEGDHFVHDVLRHPKLFVMGGRGELERLAEMGMADQPPAHSRRNPRVARRRRARSTRQ